MVLTLYKTDPSPSARAVLMTVELLRLDIETVEVDVFARQQCHPKYIEKNPTHTVPMIEDGDFILADSHAIITYLVSKYGEELRVTLYPTDLKTKATIDHRLYVDATLVFPKTRELVNCVVLKKCPGPTAEQIDAVLESYGFLEKFLEKTTFLAADHLTVADISAVSTVSSLNVFVPVDTEKFPKITKWWENIKINSWYQKGNVPGLTHLEDILKNAMAENSKT